MKPFLVIWTALLVFGFIGLVTREPTTPLPANAAATVGPAPPGDAATVALPIILGQFDPPDCPRIQTAVRTAEGGIHVICTNQEAFRVFTLNGKPLAMRWIGLPPRN